MLTVCLQAHMRLGQASVVPAAALVKHHPSHRYSHHLSFIVLLVQAPSSLNGQAGADMSSSERLDKVYKLWFLEE